MANKNSFTKLRTRAEEILKEHGSSGERLDSDLLHLVHELDLYQVELELQNEELRRAQKDLEDSRNQYFDLYDSAPVGFVVLNPKGLITRANRTAEEVLGSPDALLNGRAFSKRIRPKDQSLYFACIKKVVDSGGKQTCEVRLTGKEVYVRIEADAHFNEAKNLTEWRLALSDITSLKEAEKALRSAHEQLKRRAVQLSRLTSELTLSEQRERRRLAEILHDHLQQLLVGAKINIEILSANIGKEHAQPLGKIIGLINQSIQTSRSLTAELAHPALQQGHLSAALQWLALWIHENHGLKVDLQTDPATDPEQEDITVLLFKSIKELLLNVVKHAGVDTVRLETSRDQENRLRIAVLDQGRGFDPDAILGRGAEDKGFGLFSIRERLTLLGGSLEIESSPGNGTATALVVPYEITRGKEANLIERRSKPESRKKSGEKIRLLLADDHTVVRQGISAMLNLHADVEVVGEAADGKQAIEKARKLQPDVILMDISMPLMDGVEATRIISLEFPHIRIIGLSMHDKEDKAARMVEAGASAYCTKGCATDILLSAIRGGKQASGM